MKRKLLSLLTTTLLVGLAHGQVVFHSVEDAWKYADDHNIAIRMAQSEALKAAYARSQSYSALLPQVSATGSFTDNTLRQQTLIPTTILGRTDGGFIAVPFGQQYVNALGLTAQVDIVNLQTWFNIRAARAAYDVSKDSLASTRKNMYLQIASQYYNYLLMQEAAKISAQSADIADSVSQSMSNKFATGTVNQANLDVAKINLARAQQTLITAQYQALAAKNNLRALLDMSLSDSLNVDASLSSSLHAASDDNFTEDPGIRLAYHNIDQSRALYNGSNTTFVPTISLLYSAATQQNDNKFEPFEGRANWYPANYISLRASWNIFTGGNRYYQSKRNQVTIKERQIQYDNVKKQSAINDENLRLSYRKAAAVLEKARNVMDLSFDNYTHITYRYNEGLSSIDDRLNAFNDYLTYQNQYLNSLSDMLMQLYQVKIRQQSF